jgi:hypothetical protein
MSASNYLWRECYLHAILETNPDLKFVKIYEAIAAIEQRRLRPVETDEECRELASADEGVQALIAELAGGCPAPRRPFR